MKNKWIGIRVFISICLAIGWWDFWYPELTEAAGVYEVVYEESAIQTSEEMIKYELDEYTITIPMQSNINKAHSKT